MLLNIFNNLAERIHKIKCKYGHNDKSSKMCRMKYKYCECFLEYARVKKDLKELNYFCCNKNYSKSSRKTLKGDLSIHAIAPGLTSQAALKKSIVKLDILADTDILLMLKKALKVEYVMIFTNMRMLITHR